MSYNNSKSQNNNGRNYNNKPYKSKEEYQAEKARQIEMQTKSIDIIAHTAEFLNECITADSGDGYKHKITMKQILAYLNDTYHFEPEDTRVVSQFNYLLMELANARRNRNISGDRLNIRVMYIEERLKTSFKKELHQTITDKIIKANGSLFYWDAESNGEEYSPIPEKTVTESESTKVEVETNEKVSEE